jgi:hypothetical protein
MHPSLCKHLFDAASIIGNPVLPVLKASSSELENAKEYRACNLEKADCDLLLEKNA